MSYLISILLIYIVLFLYFQCPDDSEAGFVRWKLCSRCSPGLQTRCYLLIIYWQMMLSTYIYVIYWHIYVIYWWSTDICFIYIYVNFRAHSCLQTKCNLLKTDIMFWWSVDNWCYLMTSSLKPFHTAMQWNALKSRTFCPLIFIIIVKSCYLYQLHWALNWPNQCITINS